MGSRPKLTAGSERLICPTCHCAAAAIVDLTPKSVATSDSSHPSRGAYRDRHGRWDGMRWTRQRRARGRDRRAGRKIRERSSSARDERRCCGRRSRVVLTPVAGVKSRGGFVGPTGRVKPSNSRGDGDKKELVAGEITKETVKTIAQGRPDDPPTPVVTTVCFLPLHTGHGCGGHPAFPAPSLFRGSRFNASARARSASRHTDARDALACTFALIIQSRDKPPRQRSRRNRKVCRGGSAMTIAPVS